MTPTECPHCGIELLPTGARHTRVCPRDPAHRAAIVAALSDTKRPGYAVTLRVYKRRAARCGAPCSTLLYRSWGTWAEACAYFGLQYEGRIRVIRNGR